MDKVIIAFCVLLIILAFLFLIYTVIRAIKGHHCCGCNAKQCEGCLSAKKCRHVK